MYTKVFSKAFFTVGILASFSLMSCGSGEIVNPEEDKDVVFEIATGKNRLTTAITQNSDSLDAAIVEYASNNPLPSSSSAAPLPGSSSDVPPTSSSSPFPVSSSVVTPPPSSSVVTPPPSSSEVTPPPSSSSSIPFPVSSSSSAVEPPPSSSNPPSGDAVSIPPQNDNSPVTIEPGTYTATMDASCTNNVFACNGSGAPTDVTVDGQAKSDWYVSFSGVSGSFTVEVRATCLAQCY